MVKNVEHEKTADLDQSPNSLEIPQPGKSASKKTYNLILGVLMAMGIIVLWSFLDTGDDAKKKKEEAAAKSSVESRDLMPGQDAGRGLATTPFPTPPENRSSGVALPPSKNDQGTRNNKDMGKEDMIFVGPPGADAEDEARRLEEQEERRKKREAYYSGLGSNIMVHRNGSTVSPGTTVSRDDEDSRPGSEIFTTSDGYDPAAARDRETFFSRADQSQWMSPYTREAGRDFEMKTGTVVPGVMVTGINSDLPGNIIAQVSQNVYDTATGRFLLIPQGSKIYGAYDSRVAYGQQRVLVAWNRILFPDGSSVTLGAMPGSDMAGYAGFTDQIDNHYLRIFGSAFLMSMVTGSMSYAVDKMDNSNNSNENSTSMQNEMASALAAQMGQATMKLLEKNLSISPTLTIRPGYRFNIVVTKDVIFREPYVAQ